MYTCQFHDSTAGLFAHPTSELSKFADETTLYHKIVATVAISMVEIDAIEIAVPRDAIAVANAAAA